MITATNSILTGLAVADLLVMVEYMPYCIHNYLILNQTMLDLHSYHWSVITLFHAHFSVVFHAISSWLTILLAVWRLLSLSYPIQNKTLFTMRKAKWFIIGVYTIVPIFCIPLYISFTIVRIEKETEFTLYKVDWSSIASDNEILKKADFWVFSVLTKLVPCFLLTYFSMAIIRILIKADKRKKRLNANEYFNNRLNPADFDKLAISTETNSHSFASILIQKTSSPSSFRKSYNKLPTSTTKMLLAVLLIFLITEFPCGILSLLSGIIGDKFFQNVYRPLGDLLDFLALINSAVNFILYCTMSRQFRVTFKKIFCTIDQSKYRSKPERSINECANTNIVIGPKLHEYQSHSGISVV